MDIKQFHDRFKSDADCELFLEQKRWPSGIICVHCGSRKIYHYKDGRLYKCGNCRKQFNVKAGTIFFGSKVPLRIWLLAVFLAESMEEGVSSAQLAKYTGVSQKTAWHMLHRIRMAAVSNDYKPNASLHAIQLKIERK